MFLLTLNQGNCNSGENEFTAENTCLRPLGKLSVASEGTVNENAIHKLRTVLAPISRIPRGHVRG